MEKSNLMMIVIIVLLVALLGTVVAVTVFALSAVQEIGTSIHADDGWDRTPRTLLPTQIGRVSIGDPITTNLAADAGSPSRHIRVNMSIGYDNTQGRESEEKAQMIEAQMDYIRSIILESLRTRSYNEISARDGTRLLQDEILDALQNQFQTNMIVGVFITDWLVM